MDGTRSIKFTRRASVARVFPAALVGLSTLLGGIAAHAQTSAATRPRIQVRRAGKIEAHTARSDGDLILSGTLRDDLGQPLPGKKLAVSLTRGDGAQRVPFASVDTADAPTGCVGPPSPGLTVKGGDTLEIAVDDAGRFCARIPLPRERYTAHLESLPIPRLDPAKTEARLDLAKRSLAPRFDPPPRVLQRDVATLTSDAVAIVDDDAGQATFGGKLLTLVDERGTPLGAGTTSISGRASFLLETAKLGAPGPGELRLAFAGDPETGAASTALAVERRARVRLGLLQTGQGAGSPEDGIPLDVAVTTGSGDVPRGAVEVRFLDQVVGAAPVERGRAKVIASFVAPAASHAPLVITYLPDAPWYESGDPLTVDVPVRGPSPWRQLPLAAAGLAVAAFLAFGRLARRRASPPPKRDAPPRPEPARLEPGVEVVREAAPGSPARWTGLVVDAHEHTPIANVRLVIEEPSFGQHQPDASTFTDEEGRFVLELAREPREASLAAEGPLHGALKQKLPRAGELKIALVSRKRLLLERLVGWARQRGRPYDQRPEPTPGHVRRAASHDARVGRWAEATEEAAFGPSPVDARVEREVDALAPSPPMAPAANPGLEVPQGQQTQVNPPPNRPRASPKG